MIEEYYQMEEWIPTEEWEIPTYEPITFEVIIEIPAAIIEAVASAPTRPIPTLSPPRHREEPERAKKKQGQSSMLMLVLAGFALLVAGTFLFSSSLGNTTGVSPQTSTDNLATGTFGLDYVSSPSPTTLKMAGVSFVCRYLSEANPLTQGKLLTPTEAKALSNAGIAIVSNYEWYATRALEGYNTGVQDAQIAAEQHAADGGPQDRPIYFSVDVDVAGEQVAAYFQGVASIIGLSRTGAYGSYRVLKYLFDNRLITWGWQTYAWSYGAWEPRAHIQQYQNGMSLSGHSVDYDRAMTSDFGQWL